MLILIIITIGPDYGHGATTAIALKAKKKSGSDAIIFAATGV